MKPLKLLSLILLSGLPMNATASEEPMMGSSQPDGALEPEVIKSDSARVLDFNFGWKFLEKDEREAFVPDFDDSKWRNVRLPHDWSVEHSFDKELEGATAYLPGGMGWYRKTFTAELSPKKACYLCFDGIYNNAEIWLNGKRLGFHPYGYSPILHEISGKLVEGKNVLAVKVDRSRIVDSRWYTGSGIYREVKLIVVDKLHTPPWGVYVTTPEVTADSATVQIENTVSNLHADERKFELVNRLLDPDGKEVAKVS
ncbi:MAG: sugar-binding domain-containing protein, partial [Verrucomicrobiota bacterium]